MTRVNLTGGRLRWTRAAARSAVATLRVIAPIQESQVIDRILKHLREKGRAARAAPWATGPPAGDATAEAA